MISCGKARTNSPTTTTPTTKNPHVTHHVISWRHVTCPGGSHLCLMTTQPEICYSKYKIVSLFQCEFCGVDFPTCIELWMSVLTVPRNSDLFTLTANDFNIICSSVCLGGGGVGYLSPILQNHRVSRTIFCTIEKWVHCGLVLFTHNVKKIKGAARKTVTLTVSVNEP